MSAPVDPLDDPLLASVPVVDGLKQLAACRIAARLGEGAMGTVYRARHVGFDIDVAVKCLSPALSASDTRFIETFRREARVAATLTHENLIRVYDVGEAHGVHYLVMELVDGESLSQRLKRSGRLSEADATAVVRAAARGLAVAHRAGVVHRDIKPGNILIARSGVVKLADLGLAKAIDSTDELTATAVALGTPAYMPPEQWEDARTVGPAGDVYALGATWFCALAGYAPFSGRAPEIMRRVLAGEFPDTRTVLPAVSEQTAALIARCTASAVVDRVPDADALLAALGPRGADRLAPTETHTETETPTLLDEPAATYIPEPEPTPEPKPAAEPEPTSPTVEAPSSPSPHAPHPRRRGALVATALSVAAILVALFAWRARQPDTPAPRDDLAVTPIQTTDTPTSEDTDRSEPPSTADATPTEPVTASPAANADSPAVDVAPARADVSINTTPLLADVAVDGERVREDDFGSFEVSLTEGSHTFDVYPRDGSPDISFTYDFTLESGVRRILLDYASRTIKESE